MKTDHKPLLPQTAPQPGLPERGAGLFTPSLALPRQSRFSQLAVFAVVILLVMLALDTPMRAHALALDPELRRLALSLTRFGNAGWPLGLGLAALAGLMAMGAHKPGWRQRVARARVRAVVLFFLGAVAFSGIASSLTKNIIGRARPQNPDGGVFEFTPFAFKASWASFPSGHSTTAMAMMVAAAMIWPRHALGLVATGAFIALTRAFVGAHWLSDVLAGIAFGTVFTLAYRKRFDGGRRRALLPEATARVFGADLLASLKALLRAIEARILRLL